LYGATVKSLSEAHPDLGVARAPVELHRYDDGRAHVGGCDDGGGDDGGCDEGGGDDGGWDDGGGDDGPGLPVHATPFTAKPVGAGLLLVHDPLKPNDTEPLVAIEPL
jgi:hypothetical protein